MAQYIIDLTQDEIDFLENDLLDINAWIQDAVKGKINNCKKRMARQCIDILAKEGKTAPSLDNDTLAKELTKQPGYKKRKDRD